MTTQERAHYWHEQITIWRSSGLSGQAFCNQHDLAYHQFIYWRAKQDKTGADQQDTAVGFARVAPSRAVSTCGELTLSLPSGVSITGLHAGNIDLLGSLLRQL
tara:strand:- start:799 stop:1107 length:309 start_codon:yes stop_codon:yes gene_type:complete